MGNRNRSSEHGAGRVLTRRDALKTGAVAAAGMAAGCEAKLAVAQVCDAPTECGAAADRLWEIKASTLNILWGDFWPRFIAEYWRGFPGETPPFDEGLIEPAEMQKAITLMVKRDMHDLDPGPPPWNGNTFKKRMSGLYRYFEHPETIPVYFIGEGGYDFILSDMGLDLFTPPKPTESWEYLRYYAMRQSGRPSIGVPFYLDETNKTYLLDTPTGPGQILSDAELTVGGCKLVDLVPCFHYVTVTERPLVEVIKSFPSTAIRFTYTNYLAVMATLRCWQIEGAVYRGILGELPRVIAEIWLEQSWGFTGDQTYTARFSPTPPDEEDVRDIFRERLETSLPDHDHMEFRVVQYETLGDTATLLRDVLITNQGFYLPPAPALADDPGPDILEQIVRGHAGNPVFTDTKRPDGDE